MGREAVAEVYLVKGRIVMSAMAWSEDIGTFMGTHAIVTLPGDGPAEQVGAALTEMFGSSLTKSVARGPSAVQALLKAAGVRSHAALVKKARYVNARRDEDGSTVILLPSAPDAGGGGWVTVGQDEGIRLENPSDGQLGEAVLEALASSGTWPPPAR